jgi:hypothetical protein
LYKWRWYNKKLLVVACVPHNNAIVLGLDNISVVLLQESSMSLEQVLADHATAIRELTAFLRQNAKTAPAPWTGGDTITATAGLPTLTLTAAQPPVSIVEETEHAAPEVAYTLPALQPREAVAVAEPEVAVIEYAQISKAITTAFVKDRGAVVAALAKFGAKKGPELKVSDYAAFLAELA